MKPIMGMSDKLYTVELNELELVVLRKSIESKREALEKSNREYENSLSEEQKLDNSYKTFQKLMINSFELYDTLLAKLPVINDSSWL